MDLRLRDEGYGSTPCTVYTDQAVSRNPELVPHSTQQPEVPQQYYQQFTTRQPL